MAQRDTFNRMKLRSVGVIATVALLLIPAPLDVVRCEPVPPPEFSPMAIYEFVHPLSATGLIEASREVDRRLRLCGDLDMQPAAARAVSAVRSFLPPR